MAVRPIRLFGDPILRKKAIEVVDFDAEIRQVVADLTDTMLEARVRGYLRHGLCTGGLAPLIKTVAAVTGQRIEVSDLVRIDGHSLPHSRLMQRDGQGRRMLPYGGGIIPPGAVYLHSDFPGSFDSRYFGPLSTENVIGLAEEVWTYAP